MQISFMKIGIFVNNSIFQLSVNLWIRTNLFKVYKFEIDKSQKQRLLSVKDHFIADYIV